MKEAVRHLAIGLSLGHLAFAAAALAADSSADDASAESAKAEARAEDLQEARVELTPERLEQLQLFRRGESPVLHVAVLKVAARAA